MKRRMLSLALLLGLTGMLWLGRTGLVRADGDKPAKLVTAKVDTGAILQQDPAYQEMAKAYIQEQVEEESKIAKELQKIGTNHAAQAELRERARAEQKAIVNRWMNKTAEFLDQRHGKIRQAVADVCKEKGIDLVVIDTPSYPTVEWGALDITQEVMVRLMAISSPTPKATGTP